ncbi:DEAD/DEAH box helicase [Methylorubrum extorquens]|uniref:DEAD/DEAH box helicase n=1 Tax=Methylorubrum extorquens TaxID=408 RepID=UPI00209C8147|nr:DEAD/DEAH box helicase [Methylorubrum extorquens]MCP1540081.1 superfamily II DNA or RNA helicase [Methylorubrum extorquens]
MTELVRMGVGVVNARIESPSKAVKALVHKTLSYVVEGAEFSGAGNGQWDGRSSFFSNLKHTFPAGFAHMVHAELKRAGHKVHIVKHPLPEPLGPENPIVDEFGNDDPRYDYQMRTVNQLIRHGRGIAQVATGGGKSKIAKLAVARIRRPTLFLTTRGVLMHQMADGFRDAGFTVGLIGDGEWSPVRGVNCAMVQTLVARLEETDVAKELLKAVERRAAAEERAKNALKAKMKREKAKNAEIYRALDALGAQQEAARPSDEQMAKEAQSRAVTQMATRARTIKFLELIELVIGEEAHEVGGTSYNEIMRHCTKARYRLALTATPFMRADAADNMRLMGAFGPILIQVTEKELIDKGILAKPFFRFVETRDTKKLFKTTDFQRAYKAGYVENEVMHAEIIREAKIAASLGQPVMTLIQRTAHGEILATKMAAAGLRVEFLKGEDNQKARKRALAQLKAGAIDVLIGTTILDVGVDVPAVGIVQLAGGGKAEVALRQRIGRGLRAKKGGPNICFVSDYSAHPNAHLAGHARERRSIIESTPGFVEGILKPGSQHPWHMLSASKLAA